MTVDELVEDLRNLSAAGHGEAQVRLATQPSWPLEWTIDGMKLHKTKGDEIEEVENLIFNNEYPEDQDEMREQLELLKEQNETVLYLREGSQIGYASRSIWDD